MAVTFPSTDTGLLAWAQNFYAVANVAPLTWGLSASQLTAFNGLVTAYQTSLAACEPGVRNKAAVFNKNQARTNLRTSAKLLSSIVEGQATVTDGMKTTLGINVRKQPVPSPIPATAPVITFQAVSGFLVKLRLRDSASGAKRGKPASVSGASLFSFTGAEAPTDIAQFKFEGNTGKASFDVQVPNTTPKGTLVWFTAFWFNGAKQSGPLAVPVSVVIQGGSVSMTEKKAA